LRKPYIYELDDMRAIAMLGVLGIHTGAFAIGNPHVNVHFFGLADIITRFSVPIFFFISAFGIFLGQDLTKPFHYLEFLKRRIHAVLIPYIVWSLIYMLHQYALDHNAAVFAGLYLLKAAFFGLGSYHLYFLVILIWFYLLMPLWRPVVDKIASAPLFSLSLLYVLQNVFNLFSLSIQPSHSSIIWWDNLINFRLNYWVGHYAFMFLLGAVCAVRYKDFSSIILARRHQLTAWAFIGTALMMGYYYYLIYVRAYTCESAVNTLHQLHPIGIFYTLTTTLFLFAVFHHSRKCAGASVRPTFKLLALLGTHSYFIYLVHPLIMYYLGEWIAVQHLPLSVPVDILYYLATACFSLALALLVDVLKRYIPVLHVLTGTSMPRKQQNMSFPRNFGA
jgi:peptidoglycan/LPS O-acetylase OafA/YrhL